MTPQEIIDEIQKLPLQDQKEIKDLIGSDAPNGGSKTAMTEQEFLRMTYANGIIGNIPDQSALPDEDDDLEPIEIKGKPTSEIIIEDRG